MDKVVSLSVWSNPAYMKANDRERMEAFVCKYEGDCPMYSSGKCVCQNLFFGWIKCPHSTFIKNEGLTKRAKCFGDAARRWKETFKTDITIENKHLCRCGDYIYLPYPHLDVFGDKFDASLVNDRFIPAERFDVSMIDKLVNYHPLALMGGEIETFQRENVPKFIQHLMEFSPDLFNEYLCAHPEQADRFHGIAQNYIGRKAYLHTLNDGASFYDCHRNLWVKKDGFAICESCNTTLYFPAGNKTRKCLVEITDDMVVDVQSNDVVSASTQFAD